MPFLWRFRAPSLSISLCSAPTSLTRPTVTSSRSAKRVSSFLADACGGCCRYGCSLCRQLGLPRVCGMHLQRPRLPTVFFRGSYKHWFDVFFSIVGVHAVWYRTMREHTVHHDQHCSCNPSLAPHVRRLCGHGVLQRVQRLILVSPSHCGSSNRRC